MVDKIFSWSLALFAFVTPISIAATNIVFFPLAALWLLGGRKTLARWPAVFGVPEKAFLLFLGVSLLSALCGLDPRHSIVQIWHKDFYLFFAVVLIALVRDEKENAKLIKIFMAAGLVAAAWGLLQYAVGVDQTDKSDGIFLYLPQALAHWPRPLLDLLSLLNGRVMGTRGHPLAYAECLLFNWSFAICFLLSGRSRRGFLWLFYIGLVGAALLLSQSRGPWIAAMAILVLAILTPLSRRAWPLVGLGAFFLILVLAAPSLKDRATSIADRSHHSNVERLHMWHAGLELWKSHPLLGIGAGNVKTVSPEFQTPEERMSGGWGHLHSIYVNFLAERGALGLFAFFLFIGALSQELWVALRGAAQDPYKFALFKGSLLGILGYLIGGLTETSYNTAVVSMTFYFVIGLALALSRHASHVSRSTSHGERRT
jgi:putative inorganic carbon (HCO3(-)) transporter